MIADLTIQFIMVVIVLGFLGLLPLLWINRSSSRVDKNMYRKDYDAGKNLESFRADLTDDSEQVDADRKMRKFQVKDE